MKLFYSKTRRAISGMNSTVGCGREWPPVCLMRMTAAFSLVSAVFSISVYLRLRKRSFLERV